MTRAASRAATLSLSAIWTGTKCRAPRTSAPGCAQKQRAARTSRPRHSVDAMDFRGYAGGGHQRVRAQDRLLYRHGVANPDDCRGIGSFRSHTWPLSRVTTNSPYFLNWTLRTLAVTLVGAAAASAALAGSLACLAVSVRPNSATVLRRHRSGSRRAVAPQPELRSCVLAGALRPYARS